MNRLQACLFLRMISGLGNVSAKKLWEFSPSPQAIFDRSPEDFLKLEGIGTNLIGHLKNWKNFADTVYQEEENLQKKSNQNPISRRSPLSQNSGFLSRCPLGFVLQGKFQPFPAQADQHSRFAFWRFQRRKNLPRVGCRTSGTRSHYRIWFCARYRYHCPRSSTKVTFDDPHMYGPRVEPDLSPRTHRLCR